jgi:hydrogenase maturation protease
VSALRVIGVGNRWQRDDGVGAEVAARIEPFVPMGTEVVVLDGEASRLIDAWDGSAVTIVVDAMRSGAAPGTVTRDHVGADPLPRSSGAASSHALGVAEALALGRALHRLPEALVLFGVEGDDFGHGVGLSASVAAAVDGVVDEVLVELARPRAARRGSPDRPSPG